MTDKITVNKQKEPNMSNMIPVVRGDDTNALGAKITINLSTELDLTGFTAVFQAGDFRQTFSDITGKRLEVVIPRADTALLPLGVVQGALKIYDAQGLAKTICRDISLLVSREAVANIPDAQEVQA